MSMNLHCNLVHLWQTPTRITNMCMVQSNGKVAWELKGEKAKHALWIYIKWCEGKLQEVGANAEIYSTKEELEGYEQTINEHVSNVKAVMKVKKGLIVSKV